MPMIQWEFNHDYFPLQITVDPDRVTGYRSLVGRGLWIPFRAEFVDRVIGVPPIPGGLEGLAPLRRRCVIIGLQADVSVTSPSGKRREIQGSLVQVSAYDRMSLALDDATMTWVEAWREGAGMTFAVTWKALCAVPDLSTRLRQIPQSSAAEPSPFYPHMLQTYGPVPQSLPLDRERWVAILHEMEWGDVRLLEMPPSEMPPADDQVWQPVTARLARATAAYRQGDYEGTVEVLREAIEGIAAQLAHHWGLRAWRESSVTVSDEKAQRQHFAGWTKELSQRLEAVWPADNDAASLLGTLLATAWQWTSPSHHYHARTARRREAKFALQLVTDVLELSAHLMSVHPHSVAAPLTTDHAPTD